MNLFRIILTDEIPEGKRSAHFAEYLVTADDERQAVRVLAEELPASLAHVKSVRVVAERENGEIWSIYHGTLSKYQAS